MEIYLIALDAYLAQLEQLSIGQAINRSLLYPYQTRLSHCKCHTQLQNTYSIPFERYFQHLSIDVSYKLWEEELHMWGAETFSDVSVIPQVHIAPQAPARALFEASLKHKPSVEI